MGKFVFLSFHTILSSFCLFSVLRGTPPQSWTRISPPPLSQVSLLQIWNFIQIFLNTTALNWVYCRQRRSREVTADLEDVKIMGIPSPLLWAITGDLSRYASYVAKTGISLVLMYVFELGAADPKNWRNLRPLQGMRGCVVKQSTIPNGRQMCDQRK